MIKGMQALVDAQTEVSRAVFEANKPGRNDPKEVDNVYLAKCVINAIKHLQEFQKKFKVYNIVCPGCSADNCINNKTCIKCKRKF